MKNSVSLLFLIGIIWFGCKSDKPSSLPNKDTQSISKEIAYTDSKSNDGRTCDNIPDYFSSFEEAEDIVRNSEYQYSDELNNMESEWITSAEFYSCDGASGYFIMCTMKNGCYIYDDMEIDVWKRFKGAGDYGKYYHQVIKNKYQMYDRIK
jgi:KTSC domain